MQNFPLKLEKRLQKRKDNNSMRALPSSNSGVDFYSNDYLGFSKSKEIYKNSLEILGKYDKLNGSTGSRLLSGNHQLFEVLEDFVSNYYHSEAALVFNSGYDANIGFFSSVPQRGDFIFYDEFAHASIRDGVKMSMAKNYKFRHNDLEELKHKLKKIVAGVNEIYVVTESVFSMDGDSPDLKLLIQLSREFNFKLIIDEAHSTGIFGKQGEGLLQQLNIEKEVFARIHTFGKAIGCHGAVILGSKKLIEYLVNFSRSLIYTTALSPHSLATILAATNYLKINKTALGKLKKNIHDFNLEVEKRRLQHFFIKSDSPIQSCIISGNDPVKEAAKFLVENGFIVKPILSPTIPAGKERLRFCLHSYNSKEEISAVLELLSNFVRK